MQYILFALHKTVTFHSVIFVIIKGKGKYDARI